MFILGDLFESWIGDDDHSHLSDIVALGLKQLSDSGTELGFLHGNRDFLLGKNYAQRCGMALLSDPSLIRIGEQSVLLCHGDTLCTDDHAYQAYRKKVRKQDWQEEFLNKPLAERVEFAHQARARSAAHTAAASEAIMDVNSTAVVSMMQSRAVKLLIHGHTHRPAIHELSIDSEPARRIVLGAWYEQGSVLVAHQGHFELETILPG